MTGKTALVTGAGGKIGSGIALCLAEAGYDIGVHDLRQYEAAEEVAAHIEKLGRRAVLLKADLREVAQIRELVAAHVHGLGRLDVLVNNAGITRMVPFLETDEQTYDDVLAIDLKGPYFCAQSAARQMIAQGGGGVIVNVSSNNAVGCWPQASAYGAAKAGLDKLTRNMALELARFGIRVVSVAPGYTRGGLHPAEPSPFQIETSKRIPLGRFCTAREVGKAVVYVASDDAAYMTGTVLTLDGGALLPALPENDFV